MSTPDSTPPPNFLRALIAADVARGAYGGRVVTRFPPEPNGYLHIGHAKSICLNFGLAQEFGGVCHLRYDDTNPETEREEYVAKILELVLWLGFDPRPNVFFASDYFGALYEYANRLIQKGLAYVCDLPDEEISRTRGSVNEVGTPSPFRNRSVAENLDLFARMQAGEFAEGSRVLRAKIDMANPNFKMRDPLLYRIKFAHHYRTGDRWKVYPFYDFAHCLSDAIEKITHSVCTLEFENNRELYDWILRGCDIPDPPHQYEFARLNMTYTVMSKRRFLRLVEAGHVEGWDDPRMPTLAGLRRRGVTPEALRHFAERVGVAKANSVVEVELFEATLREDLHRRAPRAMAVLRPLKIRLLDRTGHDVGGTWFPTDIAPPARFADEKNTRRVPMGEAIYIDASDFSETPPNGWHRLCPGGVVRLVFGPVIRCELLVRDAAGRITELVCTVLGEGEAKPKGTLQWVDAASAVPAEIRLYDRLVRVEKPTPDDFIDELNPRSLEVVTGLVERAVAEAPDEAHWQFQRLGYFVRDAVAAGEGRLVFNRTTGLREGWKEEATAAPEPPPRAAPLRPPQVGPPRPLNPQVAARYDALVQRWSIPDSAARTIAATPETTALFEAAAVRASAGATAVFVANVVVGELRTAGRDASSVDAAAIGALVALVEGGTIGAAQGKRVLGVLLAEGGDPAEIVSRLGLSKVSDPLAIASWLDEVLRQHPSEFERLKAGQGSLVGYFVGQVLKRSGGRADTTAVATALSGRLNG
ncbi:MAG: glutamine--tRNA ligase/YqeY domain fusion protein [Myxococcales bacterium]|nr:glutamine--tRNA ligase/YqeY domain fusion protein [Myxococcales bacterium]